MGLLVVLLLASPTLTGCFAFDRIDSGLDEMEQRAARRKANEHSSENTHAGATPEPVAKPGAQKSGPKALVAEAEANLREWWGSARSIAPGGDPDSQVVACRLNGNTAFMLVDECEGRGGTPGV